MFSSQNSIDTINALMKGPADGAAEATTAALQSMFGKQEIFFQRIQELAARNLIKLLKLNHGDNLDIFGVLRALQDDEILKREIQTLGKSGKDPDLCIYFDEEKNWKTPAVGLRVQIEKLVSNASCAK
ncbi:hypothetical protein CEB3_c13860 [Peptococcaceae bacterium CEB3]|nr:hypothetical protein CEB3_c13860 [Peptococcaceae bacterium CEB3]